MDRRKVRIAAYDVEVKILRDDYLKFRRSRIDQGRSTVASRPPQQGGRTVAG
jgi:hypothetical protein